MVPSGSHILVDLYGVDDPGEGTLDLLRRLAHLAGCNVLHEHEHVFPGGGRTAILLLSQSHASAHTWPETNYVSIDLYSCRMLSDQDAKMIVEFVRKELPAVRVHAQVIPRGNYI